MSPPPDQKPPATPPWRGVNWGPSILWFFFTLMMLWMWQDGLKQTRVKTIPYSEFKEHAQASEVVECSIDTDSITGKIQPATPKPAATPPDKKSSKPAGAKPAETKSSEAKPASKTPAKPAETKSSEAKPAGKTPAAPASYLFRTVRVEDPGLVADLEQSGAKFTGERPGLISQFLWSWVLPIALMVLIWRFIAGRMKGMGQSILSIGSSKARLVAEKETSVRFTDVAGCEEAKTELAEVVDFLKDPARYEALGAKIPKGVLLVGPPGTGKTLLARAVAGEAEAPFFSINGSEFVEMFVGVGAARVRDLFEKAKAQAPCIIFIDELDSIGRQRGVQMGAVNDEREQTLNQMLAAMDGFEPNAGVVVLAATNRPEVLDRALLRPGRFDRQVVVDAPDLEGRIAILKLHQRGKPIADDADIRIIGRETPGFSGADLANVMNEAALLAARRGAHEIAQADLQEAVEKVIAGPERRSRRLNEKDKRLVAFHEVGHALVAAFTGRAGGVRKISIVPRGHAALGYTLQLPEDERYLRSRGELLDEIKGLLGGRAAEEVVFGEITTGAENDLEHATALARQMVCIFGMGSSVGLVHCASKQPQFMPGADGPWQRDCSEETARGIDQEVKEILGDSYTAAKDILRQHRPLLDTIAAELLKTEILEGEVFRRLLGHNFTPSNGALASAGPKDTHIASSTSRAG